MWTPERIEENSTTGSVSPIGLWQCGSLGSLCLARDVKVLAYIYIWPYLKAAKTANFSPWQPWTELAVLEFNLWSGGCVDPAVATTNYPSNLRSAALSH
jgi:hypothetical protein